MKSFFAAALVAIALAQDGPVSQLDQQVREAREEKRAEIREEEQRREQEAEAKLQGALQALRCWWAGLDPVSEVDEDTLMWCDIEAEIQKERDACAQQGGVWDAEWSMCLLEDLEGLDMPTYMKKQMKLMRKGIHQKANHMTFVEYQATLNIPQLQEIQAPLDALDDRADALAQETVETLTPVVQGLGAKWQQYQQDREAAEAVAGDQLVAYLIDNVSIEGKTIAELMEEDGQEILIRKKSTSTKKTMQEEGEMPTEVVITYDGPDQEEFQDFVDNSVLPKLETIRDLGDALDTMAEDARDAFEQDAEPVVDAIAQEAKALADTLGSAIKYESTLVDVQATVLAQKAAAQESSSSSIMTGIGAGIVGALAGAAVFGFVNRNKSVANNEQPLL